LLSLKLGFLCRKGGGLKQILLPPGKIGNPFADKSRQPKTEIEQQMQAFVQAAAKRVYL
jgi:hypothetical protein